MERARESLTAPRSHRPLTAPAAALERPQRRMPIGAELFGDGAHFRVWAPDARRVELLLEDASGARFAREALERGGDGDHALLVPGLAAGQRYRFVLDGGAPLPDPASRWQPEGPTGPSVLVDPDAFAWTDLAWGGADPREAVLYELHVGTFTPEGTFAAAEAELPYLAELGVTVIELMPVAEFAGRFGWGYDGVCLFAPYHGYGPPDALRSFVNAAHRIGIAVILDVVYNHFGPDGNMLPAFARSYVSARRSEWGDAPNYDGDDAGPVREFFLANAGYWVDEFHMDGLRLDATQQIFDTSREHILGAIVQRARDAAPTRRVYVCGENEPQQVELLLPRAQGGHGCDALWNDDFHHSARVAATGRREAYFSDHLGTPQELLSALRHGFLFQGQRYAWQDRPRGTPTRGLPPWRFVHFLENHDQVANTGLGRRLHQHAAPGRLRALTALLLLGPQTPLLFQGQEYASARPFRYFADHGGALGEAVRAGRSAFVAQFPSLASAGMQAQLPRPDDADSFASCRLDPSERSRPRQAEALALHRDLLRLRRTDATLRRAREAGCDGAVIGRESLLVRFFGDTPDSDRLLVVNLGADLDRDAIAEPLLAPPSGCAWRLAWSSEDPRYGGSGVPVFDERHGWRLPGHSATLLRAVRREDAAVRGDGAPTH